VSRSESEEGRSVEELVGDEIGCCGVFGWGCDGSGEGVLGLEEGGGGGVRMGGGGWWEGGGVMLMLVLVLLLVLVGRFGGG